MKLYGISVLVNRHGELKIDKQIANIVKEKNKIYTVDASELYIFDYRTRIFKHEVNEIIVKDYANGMQRIIWLTDETMINEAIEHLKKDIAETIEYEIQKFNTFKKALSVN